MLIVASFKHSAYLELALKVMEQKGISKHDMIVAPLTKQNELPDEINSKSINHNGKSNYDNAFIFATIFMLLGAIYGFILSWGPIIWSLIGIIVGGFVGLFLEYVIRRKRPKKRDNNWSEVVVMVQCHSNQIEKIEKILWQHQALGISKVESYSYPNKIEK
jgi:uncharacterized membrane-anchored protein